MDQICLMISSLMPSTTSEYSVVNSENDQVTSSNSRNAQSDSNVEFVYRSMAINGPQIIRPNDSAESVYGSIDSQGSDYTSASGSQHELDNEGISIIERERSRAVVDIKQRSKLTTNENTRVQYSRNFRNRNFEPVPNSGNSEELLRKLND